MFIAAQEIYNKHTYFRYCCCVTTKAWYVFKSQVVLVEFSKSLLLPANSLSGYFDNMYVCMHDSTAFIYLCDGKLYLQKGFQTSFIFLFIIQFIHLFPAIHKG